MRKHILYAVFLILLIPGVSTRRVEQSRPDVLAKLEKPHPRLLLLQGEEKGILNQIEKHEDWRNLHGQILKECDQLLDKVPVVHVKIGRRLLDKSRECLRRVFYLSYAYRTTRDDKYAKRAEKELLAVSAFEDWNPTHFLDVAEMTMAVAIGYDWLFDWLPDTSRKIIREAILVKGIEPSFDIRYNAFLIAEHNWNQVCNAGISFGALAIAEHEPEIASKVISRAIESIPRSMITSYKPDGTYPEGFSYWGYGTSFNVLLISAFEKALKSDFGLSDLPGFLKTAGFFEHMVGPTGMAHNWGDSGLKEGLTPAMFWFAKKTNDPTLLWNQKKLLADSASGSTKNRILPALLVWGAQTDLDQIKAPARTVWVGQGPSPVAYMRTSWSDANAIFVGLKTGSPYVNHAHMDEGSFVLDAWGERWAMDFGMQDYNSLESKGIDLWNRAQKSQRWEVFRLNTFAHNTLSFNGQNQQVKGYTKIDAWSEAPDKPAAITDLSDVYEGQVAAVKRGISILGGNSVLVRDEVTTADTTVTMRWNMLTAAKVKIIDKKSVELSQNGKTMLLFFDSNVRLTIKTWTTDPPRDHDAPNPGTTFVGFECMLPAGSKATFSAIFTKSKKLPQYLPLAQWTVKSN